MPDINENTIESELPSPQIPADWVEILPEVYFKPSLEWYEQDPILIDLALQIEQTPPVGYEMEVGIENPTHQRLKWAEWEHTTEMGLFKMKVTKDYVYDIESNAWTALRVPNIVTIIKLEENAE